MKYINTFKTHASYESELNVGGVDFKIPNVSYCKDVKDVHFNPYNLIKFYVGEITGTTPQTVKIYTDSSTSVDVTVSDGNKWYSYVLPKDKGLYKIESGLYDDSEGWSNGIVTKAVVKANINYNYDENNYRYNGIVPWEITEASFKGSNTSKVTNMCYMFGLCSNLTSLDLSNFNTSKVTDMRNMFGRCTGLTSLDLSGWDTSNVNSMNYMFYYCSKLSTIRMVGCNQTTIDKIKSALTSAGILNQVTIITGDVPMTNYIKFTTSPSVASENNVQVTYADSTQDAVSYSEPSKEYSLSIPTDKIVTKIDFDNTMVDEVKVSCKINLSNTFFTNKPKTIRILNCDSTSSTSLYNLFSGSTNVETIEMKDSDFSNVTDMSDMFYKCSATTIDIANCNTSNVTNMGYMFSFCRNLTSLDVTHFDTSNVTDISSMFIFCDGLTSLDVTNFDTSNVTNMSSMFSYCSKLTSLDVTNFNTSNVTDMSDMFSSCDKLTSLDVTHFDTSNVTNMAFMFSSCYILTSLDVSGFDTSNVTNIGYMFSYCSNLTSLNLSGWDMTNVTNTNGMFTSCSNLKTIRMIGCNQTTIDKIKSALTDAGILNNVTIVTE